MVPTLAMSQDYDYSLLLLFGAPRVCPQIEIRRYKILLELEWPQGPHPGFHVVYFVCICSHVDPYGFERSEDFDSQAYEEFFSGYLSVLARRASKWSGYVGGKNAIKKNRTCE